MKNKENFARSDVISKIFAPAAGYSSKNVIKVDDF